VERNIDENFAAGCAGRPAAAALSWAEDLPELLRSPGGGGGGGDGGWDILIGEHARPLPHHTTP
jgi:hypothetical protein